MATDAREIELSEAQKRRLAEIADGAGKPWEAVVAGFLASAELPSMVGGIEKKTDYIEDSCIWLARFEQWMKSQSSRNPEVDDSRESIYSDRS